MSRRILALALVWLGACSGEAPEEPTELDAHALEVRAGQGLYRRYCALCHGRDGEGYAADDAPQLANQEWLRTASDEFITAAITEGRPDTAMSAWSEAVGGPLNDAQIATILRYLRSLQRVPATPVDEIELEGDPRQGRAVYMVTCARCHGSRGEGVDAIALANPRLLATASDGFLQYAVMNGRSGTRMQGFANQLQPSQIDDVVSFVRTFANQPPAPDPLAQAQAHAHGEHPRPPEVPALAEMDLVVNPDGRPASFTLRADRFVPAADVRRALRQGRRMIIIDARATSDWLRQRIPGAIPVPFYELSAILEELPRDGTPMIAYCGCPHAASGRVVDALRQEGFTNTAILDEGIQHWAEQDYPTAEGPQQP